MREIERREKEGKSVRQKREYNKKVIIKCKKEREHEKQFDAEIFHRSIYTYYVIVSRPFCFFLRFCVGFGMHRRYHDNFDGQKERTKTNTALGVIPPFYYKIYLKKNSLEEVKLC